jgi:hypothetical protein
MNAKNQKNKDLKKEYLKKYFIKRLHFTLTLV